MRNTLILFTSALIILSLTSTALALDTETARKAFIKPGLGAAGVELGMTRSQVTEVLGSPQEMKVEVHKNKGGNRFNDQIK